MTIPRSGSIVEILPRSLEHLGGSDPRPRQRHRTGLELREIEELLDELTEAGGLGEQVLDDIGRRLLDPVGDVLELRAERPDRGAQLVGRVGDEIAPNPVGLGELRRHRVERAGQLADLVARRRRDPAVVVAARHRPRGGDHLPQR